DHREILARCRALDVTPAPPRNFYRRDSSDRAVEGTKPVLIQNARIWTGANNGTEVVEGDVFIDKGIIKGVGHLGRKHIQSLKEKHDIVVLDAEGAWLTPGIVDPHSHLGDGSSPWLDGASVDDNSLKGTIQPWLRSLDGLNTHDDSYPLSVAGGVTTALVLPGSANAIGGQAFRIKLRPTAERSPTSMLVEPPFGLNGSDIDYYTAPRWRLMKQACGENPSRVYGVTRMDTFWAFRQAYDKARQLKESQDAYCAKASQNQWKDLGDFPEDLQWEMLVDVLRGKVKVQTHCYEAVDLDDLIRLSNEFKFSIAAVHHASEAYLVPDVLKRAYGHPPAVALFATNGRYKREAYRASEFAPRLLSADGLDVVMKSDHPVLNSRYLLYEAQQAHFYGLPANLALAAVTTKPAKVIGLDHRVGYVKEGWDADLVLWDSHPLSLGATPKQVFIDGVAQLSKPHTISKPDSFQEVPQTPNFDKEASKARTHDGLPPLAPNSTSSGTVVFANVKSVFLPDVKGKLVAQESEGAGSVVVRAGKVLCTFSACSQSLLEDASAKIVDLKGGSLAPGLSTYGPPLGLAEIVAEPSTVDGVVFDPLLGPVPGILGGVENVVRAVDGLAFGGRDALSAYRAGVTKAIVSPLHSGLISGLGTSFSLSAPHRLAPSAIIAETTALHITISHIGTPSISTQIAALRHLLLEGKGVWGEVAKGERTLVAQAESADVIATLLVLKKQVEREVGSKVKLTIAGGSEAHIVKDELASAGVGVVLLPVRPFPATWEQRRILPGPPLSEKGQVEALRDAGVKVAIGALESWDSRNARFDIAWAALESGGRINKSEALALASTDLDLLLGSTVQAQGEGTLVATIGGDLLDLEAKVVGVVDGGRGVVDLF
ncbi:carbohydrate esterase family 9 protein, partial [Peniophora sp. CONT]